MRRGCPAAFLPEFSDSPEPFRTSLTAGRKQPFMFERYTEKARRVIFFARYEASQFGAPAIEPEHLLLGLMREDKSLTARFLARAQTSLEAIRKEIEGRAPLRGKISTSV